MLVSFHATVILSEAFLGQEITVRRQCDQFILTNISEDILHKLLLCTMDHQGTFPPFWQHSTLQCVNPLSTTGQPLGMVAWTLT